jgi:RNA polymerase sporulation-specific sigma factor
VRKNEKIMPVKDRYSGVPDEELILRLRDGETEIMDYICDKYKELVKTKARSMFILGGDNEDLIQEGMIGLFKAVRDYDCGRDASFFTFADLCISRQMYTAVQAAGRKKHIPLNTYVSLYDNASEQGDGEESRLIDTLENKAEISPEEMFLDKERVKFLDDIIENELSSFEKQVLELHLTGMSYVQIAKVLGRDEKATDNALQRMKNKIKKKIFIDKA